MYRTKGLGVAYQDTVSLCPLRSPSIPPPLFFFFFFSSLFRCRLRRKPRTVLRLASIFPYLSRPPHHALCTASASCVKLCAISLTFDNRCCSGNYIPRPRHEFATPLRARLLPSNRRHSCALIFLLSTDLQM